MTDKSQEIEWHSHQEANEDIHSTLLTSTSSSDSSDAEYDAGITFETETRSSRGADTRDTVAFHEDEDWEEITFDHTKKLSENSTEQTAATSDVKMIGSQSTSKVPETPDPQQFNRAWTELPPDLIALNLRHARELNAHKLMVRHTANPPGALRGLFATEDFKAREIITEYFGRTGLDRQTVEDPLYDSTYAFADTGPDGRTIVIDAWDPITQTVMSLAAYSNDSLDPENTMQSGGETQKPT